MKPYQYQTIKDAEKKIPQLLKKLNLKVLKKNYTIFQAFRKKARFYSPLCQNEKKGKYFLKIRIQKTREVLRDLRREIEVYKILEKVNREKKLNFVFPRVIKFGRHEGINWYLKKYQGGKIAGIMKNDFGFKKFFFKKCSPRKFAQAIIAYQEIPPSKFKKLKLYKHGGWWYGQDFRYYKNTFIKIFLSSRLNKNLLDQKDIKKIEEIFKKEKKFLDKTATTFCHGDLYPSNILMKNGKILILDWGLANLNNPSFDPAMVWIQARKNKKWQREFLKFFLKRRSYDFKKLFRISLISLTIRLAGFCHWCLTENKNEYPTLASKFQSPNFSIFVYYLKILKSVLYRPEGIYEKM